MNKNSFLKTKICAKYYVLKKHLISNSRHIFHIDELGFNLYTIPYNTFHKETYAFNDISSIKLDEKNDREFTITLKRGDKFTLECSKRSSLLAELYLYMDNYNDNNGIDDSLKQSFDIFKQLTPYSIETLYEIKLKIYKSYIEIEHIDLQLNENNDDDSKDLIELSSDIIDHDNNVRLLYNNIKTIQKTENGFLIETKHKCYRHYLIINDIGKLDEIITMIIENSKAYIGHTIEVIDFDRIEFIHRNRVTPIVQKSFTIEVPVYKILDRPYLSPVIIAFSGGYILEIDHKTSLINNQYPIVHLLDIVRCNTGFSGVKLIFADRIQVVYLPPPNLRDIFISNIISLYKMQKPPLPSHLIVHEFIQSQEPLYQTRVEGWPGGEIQTEYEIDLIKGFCAPRDDEQFYDRLREFILNAYLTNFNDNDPKPLQFLLKIFAKHATIMLTEQFSGFAEVYEKALKHAFNLDFSHNLPNSPHALYINDSKLPEFEYDQLIMKFDEEMQAYMTKFQFEGTEKDIYKELNKKTYPQYIFRVEELLKALIILISSKSLYKEITTNKKDYLFYENILDMIVKLLDYPVPLISQLAGSFLHALLKQYNGSEKKIEAQNKHILLTSKCNLMKMIAQILTKRVLVKAPNPYLQEDPHIMQILSCLRLLKTFAYERKETTTLEDLNIVLAYLNQSYFFAIFNFLSRYKTLPCVYKTTLILNSLMQACSTKEKFKESQNMILNYSSLIALHIALALSSNSKLQKQMSVIFLSHLFVDNTNSCALICRIIPKNMFRRVDFNSNDITKWGLTQWEEFFNIIRQTFNTPSEQWTEQCKEELIEKLLKTDQEIMEKFKYLTLTQVQQLFEPSHSKLSDSLLNVRWNHEEMEFRYDILRNKLLVWKYYLSSLLKDGEDPHLAIHINKPLSFWNELNIKFISSTNPLEMKKILKVMILLYRQYYSSLQDLNTMPYWLKIINAKDYTFCRYLILQLLYASLVVNDTFLNRYNIKKFIDLNGLQTLGDILSGLYTFDEYSVISEERYVNEEICYNYTPLSLPKQANNPKQEKLCMILFILNTYKVLLTRPEVANNIVDETKLIYPIPNAKYQIIEAQTINCLVNILLLNDDDLILEVLEFFENFLCDRFTFKHLACNQSFWEFLLINISENTIEARFQLIKEIYLQIEEDLVQNGHQNPIKAYLKVLFESPSPEIVSQALQLFPILKYFPKHMIWKLINFDSKAFSQIYFSTCFETPCLLWNEKMRELLNKLLEQHVYDYKLKLQKYSEQNEIYSRDHLPLLEKSLPVIDYPNLSQEITCGPIYLRVWVTKVYKTLTTEEIPEDLVPKFIQGLFSLLNKALSIELGDMKEKQLENLLILVKSYSKIIKIYEIRDFTLFEKVFKILTHFAILYSQHSPINSLSKVATILESEFLLHSCRLIYRTIRIEPINIKEGLLITKALAILFQTLMNLVKKITIIMEKDQYDYYNDIIISLTDLKIINVIIKILVLLYQHFPRELINLSNEVKLDICLTIQKISKISLNLYDYIKKNNEKEEIKLKSPNDDDNLETPSKSYCPQNSNSNSDNQVYEFHPSLVSIFDILQHYQSVFATYSEQYILKIFAFNDNLISLILYFSKESSFISSIIQSGLAWRLLELLCYHDNLDNIIKYNDQYLITINQQAQKYGLILRNLLIFGNEAFIIQMTSNMSGPKSIILTSKERSTQLMKEISKLDNKQQNIIISLYENCLELIGKAMLQTLLEDFFEPMIIPEDKDLNAIYKFLKIFSSNTTEPTLYWNEETRSDLKNILLEQILSINKSNGKLYNDKVDKFKYESHQQELVVDDIFVKFFNKNPVWKIPNLPNFLQELLIKIDISFNMLTQENEKIRTAVIKTERNSIMKFLVGILQTLNECVKAIENILTHHKVDEDILYGKYLHQLALLSHEDHLYYTSLDIAYESLKTSLFNIFYRISTKRDGAIKIIDNVLIMRNFVNKLRNNNKDYHFLLEKIFRILENISRFDNLNQCLVRYGIYMIIIENIIKTEILSIPQRIDAFTLLTKYLKSTNDPDDPILCCILFYFPSSFRTIISMDIKPIEVLNLIDSGYETTTECWTKLMRQEILMILSEECQIIQDKWAKITENEIKIHENKVFWELNLYHKARFPELSDLIIINGINLKNYNIDPDSVENLNYAIFIDEIAASLNTTNDEFIILMNDFEFREGMSQTKLNSLDRLCCKITILMTGIPFVHDFVINSNLDQFLNNEKNAKSPFSLGSDNLENLNEQTKIKNDNKKLVSEEALTFVIKGLSLFRYKKVHRDIKCTLLQLIYLVADIDRGMSMLKSNDIMNYVSQFVCEVDSEIFDHSELYNHIEEKLGLGVILKLLIKDTKLVSEINHETFEKIKALNGSDKSYLGDLPKYILSMVNNDTDSRHIDVEESDNFEGLESSEITPLRYLNTYFWRDCNQEGYRFIYTNENLMTFIRAQYPDRQYKFPVISEFAVKYLPHPQEENLDYRNKLDDFINSLIEERSTKKKEAIEIDDEEYAASPLTILKSQDNEDDIKEDMMN